jgi:hypothetical protein
MKINKLDKVHKIINDKDVLRTIGVIFVSYLFILQNIRYQFFGDEADNILGGIVLSKNKLLYNDFVSQHPPFVYYFVSIFARLGVFKVETFRIVFSLLILLLWIFIYNYFKNYIDKRVTLFFIFLNGISNYIYWGNMWLSDNFFAYAVLIMVLLIFKYYKTQTFITKDIILLSICIYISIMSAYISVYPIAVYCIALIIYHTIVLKNYKKFGSMLIFYAKVIIICSIPFILTFVYMYFAGNLQTFIYDTFTFNKLYYSKYYPIGDTPKQIFYNTVIYNAQFISGTFLKPTFDNYFEIVLLLSNIYAVYKIKKKSTFFAVTFAILLVFLRMRGGGFHGQPYYFTSMLFLGYNYYLINSNYEKSKKTFISIFFIVIISTYVANCFGTYTNRDWYKSKYDVYIQKLTSKNDKIWAIPFDYEEYLWEDRLPASSVYGYVPWDADDKSRDKLIISDLQKNKPKLIIFRLDADTWGHKVSDYADKGVINFLNKNYTILNKNSDLEKNLYVRNDIYPTALKDFGKVKK